MNTAPNATIRRRVREQVWAVECDGWYSYVLIVLVNRHDTDQEEARTHNPPFPAHGHPTDRLTLSSLSAHKLPTGGRRWCVAAGKGYHHKVRPPCVVCLQSVRVFPNLLRPLTRRRTSLQFNMVTR